MKKALIFDFDDTLIESTVHFIETSRIVALQLGLKPAPAEDYIYFGNSWEDFIQRTWPHADLDTFKAAYKHEAEKVIYQCYPGVISMLEQVKPGREFFILTKRPRDFMAIRIKQSGLPIHLFSHVLANEDLTFQKPDPRTFDALRPHLEGYADSDVLYVGDHVHDMDAAVGAGFDFVGVETGFFKTPDFMQKGLSRANVLPTAASLIDWPGL